jgi:hypothetical protein
MNAGPRPSASSAGAQAKSFGLTDARLFPHIDALIAGINISLVTEPDAIAPRNADLAHGDWRGRDETKMDNFCTSTRDRVCAHLGVTAPSYPMQAKIDLLRGTGLSCDCQGSAKAWDD